MPLRRKLDALVAATDIERRLADDPVVFVRAAQTREDREVVGLVAASLAFGNVKTVRASVAKVLEALGPRPTQTIDACSEVELARALAHVRHRVFRGEHVARLLARAADLRREHGTLGQAFVHGCDAPPSDAAVSALERISPARARLARGLCRFADALRQGPALGLGLAHLVPDPRKGSACKRLLLYLRWMCRPDDGVDFGLFPFPASDLVIPLDTHVHRIARTLGLTRRVDASFRTAVEITDALARLDASDPVRYDFVLCHLGISGACPRRPDLEACRQCVLRPACPRGASVASRSAERRAKRIAQ